MKSEDGRDAENILFGSTLANDRHAGRTFDYLIANPPYGKNWKRDEDAVRAEHDRVDAGRFGPGLPRISDGQLLFLLHMLAHMKKPKEGGSRIAIIMNGSPLFTGDAGSGESDIRRWIAIDGVHRQGLVPRAGVRQSDRGERIHDGLAGGRRLETSWVRE